MVIPTQRACESIGYQYNFISINYHNNKAPVNSTEKHNEHNEVELNTEMNSRLNQ